MSSNPRPTVWLLKAGEPLPTEDRPRLLRMGVLAGKLVERGWDVTWWTPTFDHRRKSQRPEPPGTFELGANYRLELLRSTGYASNVSLARVRSLRMSAHEFARAAKVRRSPDLLVAAYPFPELCFAGLKYAEAHGLPFVLDIRDPFPDHLAAVAPRVMRPGLLPVVTHYRSQLTRLVTRSSAVTGVSESMLEWALQYTAQGSPRSPSRLFHIGANPLDPSPVVPTISRFTPEDPLVCLFICSGGHSFDGETIIRAFNILEARGERRIRCRFTGEGPRHELWRSRCGSPANVEFTGYVTERMSDLLREAHVGLVSMSGDLPRFWLGNKFFEYMSGSLGVLNSAEGDASKMIEACRIGWNIPSHDAHALADQLQRLADSPSQVTSAMQNCEAAFRERFVRSDIYEEFAEFLSVIAKAGRS